MAEKKYGKNKQYYRRKLYLGKDENGKSKYKYFYAHTVKEVNKKKEDYIKKHKNKKAAKLTFENASEQWLLYKSNKTNKYGLPIGDSQIKNYKCYLKHINHYYGQTINGKTIDIGLGNLYVGDITKQNIIDLLDALAKNNPNTNKPAADDYIKPVLSTMRQVFDWLFDNAKIETDPTYKVKAPKGTKNERESITEEAREAIMSLKDSGHEMQLPAMIMLLFGVRRGELLALRWSDIDFRENVMRINKAVSFFNPDNQNQPRIKNPKTESSKRDMPIDNHIAAYLKNEREKSTSKKYVCHRPDGEMYTNTTFRRAWKDYNDLINHRIYELFGFESEEHITPHMLRHTYCTLLHRSGVPVGTAQKLMGHKDPRMTLIIYNHCDELGAKKEATADFGSYIFEKYNKYWI